MDMRRLSKRSFKFQSTLKLKKQIKNYNSVYLGEYLGWVLPYELI